MLPCMWKPRSNLKECDPHTHGYICQYSVYNQQNKQQRGELRSVSVLEAELLNYLLARG